jgi:hypothetical protein
VILSGGFDASGRWTLSDDLVAAAASLSNAGMTTQIQKTLASGETEPRKVSEIQKTLASGETEPRKVSEIQETLASGKLDMGSSAAWMKSAGKSGLPGFWSPQESDNPSEDYDDSEMTGRQPTGDPADAKKIVTKKADDVMYYVVAICLTLAFDLLFFARLMYVENVKFARRERRNSQL